MEILNQDPYLASFLIGLIYGWTSCSLICMPYISLYIIGSAKKIGKGLKLTMLFNGGRILTYAFLGLSAGLLGSFFLKSGNFRILGSLLLSLAVILIGLSTIIGRKRKACESGKMYKYARDITHNDDMKAVLMEIGRAHV